jgi:hypothetical protein
MKMAARLPKRKRASNGHEYMNDANDDKDGRYEQTTEDDRRKWTGWCEVESEPVIRTSALARLYLQADPPLDSRFSISCCAIWVLWA